MNNCSEIISADQFAAVYILQLKELTWNIKRPKRLGFHVNCAITCCLRSPIHLLCNSLKTINHWASCMYSVCPLEIWCYERYATGFMLSLLSSTQTNAHERAHIHVFAFDCVYRIYWYCHTCVLFSIQLEVMVLI